MKFIVGSGNNLDNVILMIGVVLMKIVILGMTVMVSLILMIIILHIHAGDYYVNKNHK